MKPQIHILTAFVLAAMIIPACEMVNPDPVVANKVELRKKSADLVKADQLFAFELFSEVYKASDKDNIMISPLSVSYALGMTYNGAAGTTHDAFADVLHFGDLTNQEVNESYKDLMGQIVTLDDKVEFSIANSIWYKMGYEILETFISENQEYFDAAVREMDFSDPESVNIINEWIEDKTNDKIQDMLDFIPPDAVMYLINAIYFNADWKYQFDPEDTEQGDFIMENGAKHQADFMKLEGAFNYAATEDFTAVELPYGDSAFSMIVMLPAGEKKIGDLVESLDSTTLAAWENHASPQTVNITLPKFKYDFKDLLNDPLKNLGLEVAFTGAADFSRILAGGDLFISRVIHQTFIDVNEEGTEAAAATIVELRENSVSMQFFKADQPFVYLIKENSTNAIMFMGKVGKPEHE